MSKEVKEPEKKVEEKPVEEKPAQPVAAVVPTEPIKIMGEPKPPTKAETVSDDPIKALASTVADMDRKLEKLLTPEKVIQPAPRAYKLFDELDPTLGA